NSREEFRKVSIIKPACIEQISGLGWQGYLTALEHLIKFINSKN
ncbi:MAG: type II 3-dehydroquinate dehydratase, partial [Candidatus Zixiibacteriota bacterium]